MSDHGGYIDYEEKTLFNWKLGGGRNTYHNVKILDGVLDTASLSRPESPPAWATGAKP
jgi:hypothetical protein